MKQIGHLAAAGDPRPRSVADDLPLATANHERGLNRLSIVAVVTSKPGDFKFQR
jgi:hypothetical protein